MSKPTIFFSHSSKDQDVLTRLKELFLQKTGSAIEVFLSSDGQSIPLGRNWVHKVEEAMESASLMVTFATPSSLASNWLYFESGFAYAKGIQVVPVGFLGVDLAAITPPLSLLQGFNIRSEDGFNNIIAVANAKFSHSHAESFSDHDYRYVVGSHAPTSYSDLFGHHIDSIDDCYLHFIFSEETRTHPYAIPREKIMKEHLPEWHWAGNHGTFEGGHAFERGKSFIIAFDPSSLHVYARMADNLVRDIMPISQFASFHIVFGSSVRLVPDWSRIHKITSMTWSRGVRVVDPGRWKLAIGKLEFSVYPRTLEDLTPNMKSTWLERAQASINAVRPFITAGVKQGCFSDGTFAKIVDVVFDSGLVVQARV